MTSLPKGITYRALYRNLRTPSLRQPARRLGRAAVLGVRHGPTRLGAQVKLVRPAREDTQIVLATGAFIAAAAVIGLALVGLT
jgi:hypothetical protein